VQQKKIEIPESRRIASHWVTLYSAESDVRDKSIKPKQPFKT